MKQPKRLTRWQKECLSAYHFNVEDWALLKETESHLHIINKVTGQQESVDKCERERR